MVSCVFQTFSPAVDATTSTTTLNCCCCCSTFISTEVCAAAPRSIFLCSLFFAVMMFTTRAATQVDAFALVRLTLPYRHTHVVNRGRNVTGAKPPKYYVFFVFGTPAQLEIMKRFSRPSGQIINQSRVWSQVSSLPRPRC